MRIKFKRIGIFILLFVTLAGSFCYTFRNEIKAHFIPSFEQLGEIHIHIQNDTCYVSSKLVATNKSIFKIGIDTIKYKVALFNKTYQPKRKVHWN